MQDWDPGEAPIPQLRGIKKQSPLLLETVTHPAELVGHCSPCYTETSSLSYSDIWLAAPACRSGFIVATPEWFVLVMLGRQPGNTHVKVTVCQQSAMVIFAHTLRTHCAICQRLLWLLPVLVACRRWDERDSAGLWRCDRPGRSS